MATAARTSPRLTPNMPLDQTSLTFCQNPAIRFMVNPVGVKFRRHYGTSGQLGHKPCAEVADVVRSRYKVG
jgi:hypothetical protein